jgi:hypothetical protein
MQQLCCACRCAFNQHSEVSQPPQVGIVRWEQAELACLVEQQQNCTTAFPDTLPTHHTVANRDEAPQNVFLALLPLISASKSW